MITFFTIPKAFVGHTALIQRNALLSWRALSKETQIILYGDEAGIPVAATEFHALHIPDIAKNGQGTPLLNAAFQKTYECAAHPILCYSNADIIFLPSLVAAIDRVARDHPIFLIVGRRTDLDISSPLNFSKHESRELLSQTQKQGKLHGYSGIDYFIYPKSFHLPLPPFAVGRPGWDNWCIYFAKKHRIPIVDATAAITAIHQNHTYGHAGGKQRVFKGEEALGNIQLAGGFSHLMSIRAADFVLRENGLARAPFSYRLYSFLNLFFITRMVLAAKRALQFSL